MLKALNTLPSDPAELRAAAEGLARLANAQALEIEKLKHQLKGHQRHRFGSNSESADQLNPELQLEEDEIAAAASHLPKRAAIPSQSKSRSANRSRQACRARNKS